MIKYQSFHVFKQILPQWLLNNHCLPVPKGPPQHSLELSNQRGSQDLAVELRLTPILAVWCPYSYSGKGF